jgi:hypothetical protein
MRETITRCVAALAALLMLSCASSGPAPGLGRGAPEGDESPSAAPAPGNSSGADGRFIALHAALLEELSPLESAALPDHRAIEARSIIAGAEEMYLRGKTQIGLELLGEAEAALKRAD